MNDEWEDGGCRRLSNVHEEKKNVVAKESGSIPICNIPNEQVNHF